METCSINRKSKEGLFQLIRDCQPRNVMFVHGEAGKMEFLKEKVEKVTFASSQRRTRLRKGSAV